MYQYISRKGVGNCCEGNVEEFVEMVNNDCKRDIIFAIVRIISCSAKDNMLA